MKQRYQLLTLKNKGYSMTEISQIFGISRDTLYRWQRNREKYGLKGLVDRSRRPRSHPRAYSARIKKLIRELRKEYQVDPDKIALKLAKYYGLKISVSGVAKELKRAGLVKSEKKKRKQSHRCLKRKRYLPGEKLQLDVKFVFKSRKSDLFQFSSIDLDTAIVFGRITEEMDNTEAINFLKRTNLFYPFRVKTVQTDNATYFTNYYIGYPKSSDPLKPRLHPFDLECNRLKINHLLIDKGKPQQNGKVERFHRTINDEFYQRYTFKSRRGLETKFREYLYYYNNQREHLGLEGLTPLEKLQIYQRYRHISSIPFY